mmetsp:Transcript_151125/g.275139  ORF Transcript_151125/g.275139 Transcript_151125/m.275139 type:complete len:160 (-) Transcript_151125:96-575(-)
MSNFVLVLACLTCAGHARRVQSHSQTDQRTELSMLLEALNLAAGFNPSVQQVRSSVSRLASTRPRQSPLMKEDAGIQKAEPTPKPADVSINPSTAGLTVDQDGKNNMWSTQSSKMTFKEEEKVGLQKYGDLLGSVLIIALLLPLFPIIFAGNEDQVGFQ